MSRYVLTQEQLDRLQNQIQQLTRLNNSKQERIRELERRKVRVSTQETADLVNTIGSLESEIDELTRSNDEMKTKINRLEMLLKEEQKLREYSENLAKQVELKYAEETLIRELTAELCQLQKAEIEIDNKQIQDLQKKIKRLSKEPMDPNYCALTKQKDITLIANTWSKENTLKNKQLKFIAAQLKAQLLQLQKDVERDSVQTKEGTQRAREIKKWLKEANLIMNDFNNIENLKEDLKFLRTEIENRQTSGLKAN